MATRGSRSEKVKRIFQQFDLNRDGGLNREEMAALVVAVNPRVKFSNEQISAILDEVFRTYADFIHSAAKGLTYDGLLRTYDDGAGDVDRDFEALGLDLIKPYDDDDNNNNGIKMGINDNEAESALAFEEASASSAVDERAKSPEPQKQHRTATWAAASPSHGIVFDDTWKLVDDLEILIKRLKSKQTKTKLENSDAFSDPGWSRELGPSMEMNKQIVWDENRHDYAVFVKELGVLRSRADGSRSREEAFDGHMALGRILYDQRLFKESLTSFKRACELQPTDVRPHFRSGNCYHVLGRHNEAKDEFILALDAAESGGHQWSYLLPQIHVNLGISLEGEGLVMRACEHYREAAILCPTHFRALKLLGSALFGVGEYKAAVKALEEAIFLKNDYADAHCDLASALHAMGNDENAVKEFQKAIDLKPGHVDALYNLGGVYMDMGRYQRASEVYVRVLGLWPNHWRAQLNKAVSLLGAGETEEAKKSLKEALKMTSRVELHDALSHLKQLQKKKLKGSNGNEEGSFTIVEPSRYKTVGERTTTRQDLATALDIRSFQRITRLFRCDVELLKKDMNETEAPLTYSGYGVPEKSIRKAALEAILRRLLSFLKPETFVGAVKAINLKILSVLDESESGRVDLGMFFAVLAPICGGTPDKRKRVAFDSLVWRLANENGNDGKIRKADALRYIELLRSIYLPSEPMSERLEIHGETEGLMVSLGEFVAMFDDQDWGFGVMSTLLKLENGDRNRHGSHVCATCRYPIIGSRFKEMKSRFSVCSVCYSEGKVPNGLKQEEYEFKEYGSESEAVKDKCMWFSSQHSKRSSSEIRVVCLRRWFLEVLRHDHVVLENLLKRYPVIPGFLPSSPESLFSTGTLFPSKTHLSSHSNFSPFLHHICTLLFLSRYSDENLHPKLIVFPVKVWWRRWRSGQRWVAEMEVAEENGGVVAREDAEVVWSPEKMVVWSPRSRRSGVVSGEDGSVVVGVDDRLVTCNKMSRYIKWPTGKKKKSPRDLDLNRKEPATHLGFPIPIFIFHFHFQLSSPSRLRPPPPSRLPPPAATAHYRCRHQPQAASRARSLPPATAARRHRRRHATVIPFSLPRPPSPPSSSPSPPQPPPRPPSHHRPTVATTIFAAVVAVVATIAIAVEASKATAVAAEATATTAEATAVAAEATAVAAEATAVAAEATATTAEAPEATAVAAEAPATTPEATVVAAESTEATAVAAEATAVAVEATEATAVAVEATAVAAEATEAAAVATEATAVAAEATAEAPEATAIAAESPEATAIAAEATTTIAIAVEASKATAIAGKATEATNTTVEATKATATIVAAAIAIFGKMENEK
ncbi:hypothetical protein OSB04_un000371 [Centaurea solstitialis]|uniref:EF-hand domain-containing protein n=1 Tax=Centaurea solstitialis TaxID=347529 RepID=A0AA38SCU2_9ASTR|nr:hypothetical protein OSB04_un000371 [Centaurea solstitialis]